MVRVKCSIALMERYTKRPDYSKCSFNRSTGRHLYLSRRKCLNIIIILVCTILKTTRPQVIVVYPNCSFD